MLNKARLIHRKKHIVGGKVMYTYNSFKGGSMTRVSHIKHLGKTYTKHHGQNQVESTGGSARTSAKSKKSVHSSILKSLSKRGGTLSRY